MDLDTSSLVLERATLDDAEAILALQKMAFKSEAELYNNCQIQPLTQSLADIESEFEDHYVLKAVSDGKIVGSVRAAMRDETCFIGKLFVRPNYQNQGIGTLLMQEIERLHSCAGKFELFTGYKSGRNIHLYQKLGYKIVRTATTPDIGEFLCFEK